MFEHVFKVWQSQTSAATVPEVARLSLLLLRLDSPQANLTVVKGNLVCQESELDQDGMCAKIGKLTSTYALRLSNGLDGVARSILDAV
jgi:hypothetical protein